MARIRNKLIAFFCVLVFIALSTLYYKVWVVRESFAVVLILADGFDHNSLGRKRLREDGEAIKLRLDRFPYSATVTTPTYAGEMLDHAAFGTLLATGEQVANGWISLHSDGSALRTLMDRAHSNGRTTGLVTNARLAEPLLAPFYANASPEFSDGAILEQLIDLERVDVLLGEVDSNLADGRNLPDEFSDKGYDVAYSMVEVLRRPEWKFPRVAAMFQPGEIVSRTVATPESPTLAKLVRAAIRFLQYNSGGYFLVVHAAEDKDDPKHLVTLEEVVRTALDFTGENSLIIVAGVPADDPAIPQDLLVYAKGKKAKSWNGTRSMDDLYQLVRDTL